MRPDSPSPDAVFFLDRAIQSNRVIEASHGIGARIELHMDHFSPDAADTEWLMEVGRRGWFVVTHDEMLLRNPLERIALKASGAGTFILVSRKLTGQQMADALVAAWPKILRFAATHSMPFIAKVYSHDHSVKALSLDV